MSRSRLLLSLLCLLFAVSPLQGEEGKLLPADRPISEAIDHYIGEELKAGGIEPAPIADDANLVRRLTLDLAGRIPTAAEARAYVESSEPDKRLQLVERLLASPGFAFHQRNWLDEMLLAEKKNDGPWREYLLEAVRENRPWDEMFREMMLGREGDPDEQPALAFLKARARSLDDLTNETSLLFFGVNIGCAKCHDHPLVSDWLQDHYFGFASFFDRTYLTKKNLLAEKPSGQVKFKTTAGEEKLAKLMFLSGTVVEEPAVEKTPEERKAEDEEVKQQMQDDKAPPPTVPEFSPRARLVEIALDSTETPFLARSIVNRTWARLTGFGLVDPLDQMHSGNPPSHPELLDWLTRDLLGNGYDLKRLVRGIVLSETYARSSRWPGSGGPPGPDYFAVAQPRPLAPRQYALSLLMATANPESFPLEPKPEEWEKRREGLENAANGFAGQIERPGENFQVSVDEALLFSNSQRVEQDFLRDGGDRLVGHLKNITDRRELIETAFWSVLSRAPEEDETAAFEEYLNEREDRPVAGIQQVVWALLTSPELRFNY